MAEAMIPMIDAAERISAQVVALAESGVSVLGLMCECHYGEDFDVRDVARVFDIMGHTQYDHVSPREMYIVRVEQVTW